MVHYQTYCNNAKRYHSNVQYFLGVKQLYKCMHIAQFGLCWCGVVCVCVCVTDELFMCIEDIWLCSVR